MTQAPELAADYYRENFLHLLDFVAERYWGLLPAAEQAFYQRFKRLPASSQQLYIRLLSRRGHYFRLSKLHYSEIGDLLAAATPLTQCALMQINPSMDLHTLLPLFTKLELANTLSAQHPALGKQQPRASLVTQLIACNDDTQQQILAQLCDGETILKPLDTELFTCFQLCFFGNLRQNLTDYVLRDLGLQRYENYSLDGAYAPFSSQQQLAQHQQYYALVDSLSEDLQEDASTLVNLWRQLPRPETEDITLTRRVQRTTNTLARQLERLGAVDAALMLYQNNQRPPARERRARLLVKQGHIEAGLTLCKAMAYRPHNEEERVFAAEFGSRHARKFGVNWSQPMRYAPPEEQVTLAADSSVERAAAQHYAEQGACYYVENSLFNGVLGLFIWDILFAPVRGAFFNPFQSGPADFREHSFVHSRQRLFEQRFIELDHPQALRQRVLDTWEKKLGLVNPLVHWERLSTELLETALERIPGAHWRSVFQRILDDPQHNRTGLPDLILFPRQGHYQLIEVKAPGDRLQKNQQRWMQFFAEQDIPHQVSHIRWLSA